MIKHNADQSARRIEQALGTDTEPRETLVGYATGLLTLLTGEGSVAINRAAMSSADLAEVLLAHGRHRIGPLVETYLALLSDAGHVRIENPGEAFELLYGLVMRDTQIRVLLGEPAPDAASVHRRAAEAVDQFLTLSR